MASPKTIGLFAASFIVALGATSVISAKVHASKQQPASPGAKADSAMHATTGADSARGDSAGKPQSPGSLAAGSAIGSASGSAAGGASATATDSAAGGAIVGDSASGKAVPGALGNPDTANAAHRSDRGVVASGTAGGPAHMTTVDAAKLAKLYAGMPAAASAKALALLSDSEIQQLLSLLNPRQASAMMAGLSPERVAAISRASLAASHQ